MDRVACQRRPAIETDIACHLRNRFELVRDVTHRPSAPDKDGQDLQGGDETVPGCRMIGEDHVTGRLATEIAARVTHAFHDVAVSHRRAFETKTAFLKEAFKTEIRHHGADDGVAGKFAAPVQPVAEQCHDLIAIDECPVFIGEDGAVRIPVNGDADIGAIFPHRPLHRPGRGRTAVPVDVRAVRVDAPGE